MTDEEARALKVGDRVLTRVCGKTRVVVVEDIVTFGTRHLWFQVRRPGRDRRGRRYEPLSRIPRYLTAPDDGTGHVYADFLEEHGFPEAAAALRGAFPMAPVGHKEGAV